MAWKLSQVVIFSSRDFLSLFLGVFAMVSTSYAEKPMFDSRNSPLNSRAFKHLQVVSVMYTSLTCVRANKRLNTSISSFCALNMSSCEWYSKVGALPLPCFNNFSNS